MLRGWPRPRFSKLATHSGSSFAERSDRGLKISLFSQAGRSNAQVDIGLDLGFCVHIRSRLRNSSREPPRAEQAN